VYGGGDGRRGRGGRIMWKNLRAMTQIEREGERGDELWIIR